MTTPTSEDPRPLLYSLMASVREHLADNSRDRALSHARLAHALERAEAFVGPVGSARHDPTWFAVERGDLWAPEALRCPACGGRWRFSARLDVMIDARSHPLVIQPIPHAPATPVECARCYHTARYHDFLPPWPAVAEEACECDEPALCQCRLPLTEPDRTDEREFMVGWFSTSLNEDPREPLGD